MTQRENLLRAMRRQNPEFVPYHLTFTDAQREQFQRKTGETDAVKYFDLCAEFVYLPETQSPNDYSKYHANLPSKAFIDEWGVGQEPGSVAHFTHMHHPMKDFTAPKEVWEYPYPDMLADYRWEHMKQKVDAIHEKGRATVFFAIQVFEYAWYLRGLDNLLVDMLTDEDMAQACLDRMTAFESKIAAKAASCGFDIIVFGDDVGTQRELMMSPELWRRWLKPTMKEVIASAKAVNPDVLAYYHSDGVITSIIPELIEIGVDILNPIQPECMDPCEIKRLYGNKLSFWGAIGTQTTMPFGTTADVEKQTKEYIETVGVGGGFCVAPTHIVEPEVPWENILAFVEAAKKHGKY